MVHPIGLHDEFLRVHALTRDRHFRGAGLGVLLQQALVALRIHPKDFVACAESVQLRPPIEMLERIVGPIVGAPAHEGFQVAATVVILLEEFPGGGNVGGEQPPLQDGPAWRLHPRLDANGDVRGLGSEPDAQAEDSHQEMHAMHLMPIE